MGTVAAFSGTGNWDAKCDLRLLSKRKSNLDDFILTIHPPTLDSFSLNLQFLSIRSFNDMLGRLAIPR